MCTKSTIEEVDMNTALHWFFTHNCYPPMNVKLIPLAKKAIEKAVQGCIFQDEEMYEKRLRLPRGFKRRSVTVREAIEALRLEEFVEYQVEVELLHREDD